MITDANITIMFILRALDSFAASTLLLSARAKQLSLIFMSLLQLYRMHCKKLWFQLYIYVCTQ